THPVGSARHSPLEPRQRSPATSPAQYPATHKRRLRARRPSYGSRRELQSDSLDPRTDLCRSPTSMRCSLGTTVSSGSLRAGGSDRTLTLMDASARGRASGVEVGQPVATSRQRRACLEAPLLGDSGAAVSDRLPPVPVAGAGIVRSATPTAQRL